MKLLFELQSSNESQDFRVDLQMRSQMPDDFPESESVPELNPKHPDKVPQSK